MKQFTYGNGIVHTLTQSVRQLPDVSKDAFGTNRVFEVDLNFDRNGNLLSSTDLANANRNRTMTYDGLDRLLTATAPGLWGTASYSYDVLDNLRTNTLGAASYTYAYDTNNRLDLITRAGNTSWDYSADLRGNVLADGRNSYTFTRANRLAGVTGKETYQYDGHGRRTVVWRQDGTGMVPVYGLDGTLRYTADNKKGGGTSHIYLGDDPVADVFWNWTTGTQTTAYTHTDSLGSPIATTDAGRMVIDRNEYAPYGLPVNSTVDGPGFTGHVMDQATGLIYMQQRYYDPVIGRFLSVDPVAAREGGDNFSRYNYAANNPYKYVDPDGREIRYFQQGEEEIRAQIAAAKASTPEIRQMIEALEDSPNVHNIGSFDDSPTEMLQASNTATGPGESDLTGTGTNTYYDPGRSPAHHGVKQSPVEILVHELKHADMKDQGVMPAQDAPPDPETGNPAREQPAIDMQNDYRRSQGEEIMIEEYN